jgi:hypothetical protein
LWLRFTYVTPILATKYWGLTETPGQAGSVLTGGGSNELLNGSRPNVSAEVAQGADYDQQALVPLYAETHSATDVAVRRP